MQRRVKKRPSARNKVKKIDPELLSSQLFSQSQPALSKVEKNFNSDESEDEDNGYDVNDATANINTTNLEGKKGKNVLTTYSTPLSTRNWQPLPENVHQELSTLLELLTPPLVQQFDEKYSESFSSSIIKPLSQRFSKVYLPAIHRHSNHNLNFSRRLRSSNEFNLAHTHQEHTRLNKSYDINCKQLDTLVLQLAKEKEYIELERKHLRKLKDKIKDWKATKERRMSRLESMLSEDFKNINDMLKDDKNSGVNGADDVDLIDDESNKVVNSKDTRNRDSEIYNQLTALEKILHEKEQHESSKVKLENSIKQLINGLSSYRKESKR